VIEPTTRTLDIFVVAACAIAAAPPTGATLAATDSVDQAQRLVSLAAKEKDTSSASTHTSTCRTLSSPCSRRKRIWRARAATTASRGSRRGG